MKGLVRFLGKRNKFSLVSNQINQISWKYDASYYPKRHDRALGVALRHFCSGFKNPDSELIKFIGKHVTNEMVTDKEISNFLKNKKISNEKSLYEKLVSKTNFESTELAFDLGRELNLDYKNMLVALKAKFAIPEEILNDKFIEVSLNEVKEINGIPNDGKELARVKKYFEKHLCETDVREEHLNEIDTRQESIFVILGPSGSGKTFYALKGLPIPETLDGKVCTLYINLKGTTVEKVHKILDDFEPFLERKIKHELKDRYQNKKLKMTLAVVFDEIFSCSDYFSDYDKLSSLYKKISTQAEKVRLILTGTGFDEPSSVLQTGTEVIKVRMQPWSTTSMKTLLKSMTFGQNATEKILDVIKRHPMLLALTSNARSAFYLANSFAQNKRYLHDNTMTSFVRDVVNCYIRENGLNKLTDLERAQVAQLIYYWIEESLSQQPEFPKYQKSTKGILKMYSSWHYL